MSESVPDIEGYLLPEACRVLQQAGLQVEIITTGNSRPNRSRVLRQRQLNANLIELTQGYELYKDPSIDEKEVKG